MCVHAERGAELRESIYTTMAGTLNKSAGSLCPVSASSPRHPSPCSEMLAFQALGRHDPGRRQSSGLTFPGQECSAHRRCFAGAPTPLCGALPILQRVLVPTLAAGGPEKPQGRAYLRQKENPPASLNWAFPNMFMGPCGPTSRAFHGTCADLSLATHILHHQAIF